MSAQCERGSAGLAVQGVLAVPRAELLHLETVGVVAAVLLGDVVPLLAVHARERDLRADVLGLAGHLEPSSTSHAARATLCLLSRRRPVDACSPLSVAGA